MNSKAPLGLKPQCCFDGGRRLRLLGACFLAIIVLSLPARGQSFAPYGLDASTLHLWHLNETGAPAADAVTSGTNNLPLQGLLGGATLTGTGSLSRFGGALLLNTGTNTGGILLAAPALADGAGDDVPFTFANPSTGAFTFEAIVKFDSSFNPLSSSASARNMEIISMENDGSLPRNFQFRFVSRTTNDVSSGLGPHLEFTSLRGGTAETLSAYLPASGSNAPNNTDWFHVAVTYDPSVSDTAYWNLYFYWTKLTTSATTAAVADYWHLSQALATTAGDFALGNEARGTPGEGFVGMIDEVRISGTARAANAMMPSNYDSDGDGMPDAWERKYFGNLAQTASGDFEGDGITNLQEYQNGTDPTVDNNPDKDRDGLPDAWEMQYFNTLSYSGSDDPDKDGYTNAQEYAGGSNPNFAASTPNDTDGDGLPDAWEKTYFGKLTYGPNDDPDGDGYTNAQEYAAGTNPNSALSNPADTDGNGLNDAWEMKNFGHLGVDPAADPDGDWFTNLQESQAATDPNDSTSVPPGLKTRLVPVTDGTDVASSGYGYAATDINSIAYICNGLRTLGNQQFLTFYGRHQANSSYAYNNTIWVARRTVGTKKWEVFRTGDPSVGPAFTANAITDDHDTIAFGIDGEGYMHLSWGMHNSGTNSAGTVNGDGLYHYARSTAPVTGTNAITFGADTHNLTGNETEVTYPQFLTMPNGDLLYFYRVGGAGGGSGNGNSYWNRYSLATHTWSNVLVSGTTPVPLIDGISYSYNGYPNMPCMDANGNLYVAWTWRYSPAFETNENIAFAKSSDFGVTWKRWSNGSTYTLPLAEKYVSGTTPSTNNVAEQVLNIAQNSSLINQAGMCLDDQGVPVLATWWAPGAFSTNTGSTGSGNNQRQYMIAFPSSSGTTWTTRQVSNRTLDAASFIDTSATYVRDLGRPVALCDKQGRILVLYRDNHNSGGLTVAYSQTRATDPNRLVWTTLELSGTNLGALEPVVDLARWQRDNVLEVIHQSSKYTAHNGLTYAPPANSASPIGVFEWDEAAYFAPPKLHVVPVSQNTQLSWNSIPGYSYRLWTSMDMTNWTALSTFTGNGTTLSYTHNGGATGVKRFWKLEVREGSF
jgi:hypothetical protein